MILWLIDTCFYIFVRLFVHVHACLYYCIYYELHWLSYIYNICLSHSKLILWFLFVWQKRSLVQFLLPRENRGHMGTQWMAFLRCFQVQDEIWEMDWYGSNHPWLMLGNIEEPVVLVVTLKITSWDFLRFSRTSCEAWRPLTFAAVSKDVSKHSKLGDTIFQGWNMLKYVEIIYPKFSPSRAI